MDSRTGLGCLTAGRRARRRERQRFSSLPGTGAVSVAVGGMERIQSEGGETTTHSNPTALKRGSWAECGSGAVHEPRSNHIHIQMRFKRGSADAVQARLWSNRARTTFRKIGLNAVHGESGSNPVLLDPFEPHLDPDAVRTRFSGCGSSAVVV